MEWPLIGLDLAIVTGWAVESADGAVRQSGIAEFPLSRGDSPSLRYVKFRKWLHDLMVFAGVNHGGPGLVIVEMPHHRGGAATQIAYGLLAMVHERCARWGIQHHGVQTRTLKLASCGHGNASKGDMVKAAQKRWPETDTRAMTSDEADAILLLEYGRTQFTVKEAEGSR